MISCIEQWARLGNKEMALHGRIFDLSNNSILKIILDLKLRIKINDIKFNMTINVCHGMTMSVIDRLICTKVES